MNCFVSCMLVGIFCLGSCLRKYVAEFISFPNGEGFVSKRKEIQNHPYSLALLRAAKLKEQRIKGSPNLMSLLLCETVTKDQYWGEPVWPQERISIVTDYFVDNKTLCFSSPTVLNNATTPFTIYDHLVDEDNSKSV